MSQPAVWCVVHGHNEKKLKFQPISLQGARMETISFSPTKKRQLYQISRGYLKKTHACWNYLWQHWYYCSSFKCFYGYPKKQLYQLQWYPTIWRHSCPKIQQTNMLVMCQRFGDLFLFGLVWQYSSNHKTYTKGRFKVIYRISLNNVLPYIMSSLE